MVRRPAKVRLIQVQVAAKVCGAAVYGIVQRCRAVVRRPTKVCVRQIGRTAEIRPVTVDRAAKIGFVPVGAPAEISGLIEEDSAELDGVEEGASRKIVFKVRPRAVLVAARIRGGRADGHESAASGRNAAQLLRAEGRSSREMRRA